MSDADIVALAKKGADLARTARLLNLAAGVVRTTASEETNPAATPTSAEEASSALRVGIRQNDAATTVSERAVYMRLGPVGSRGRLVDACTRCSPRPLAGHSELRFAKYGPQYYSATTQGQVDRDAALAGAGFTVEWHLFLSGEADIDPRLLDALSRGDIKYVVHLHR